MSTHSEREAALRRALLDAAYSVEPAADGLERIRARLGRPRPIAVAWLETFWSVLVMRAAPMLEEAGRRLVAASRVAWAFLVPVALSAGRRLVVASRSLWERFGPASDRTGPLSWLRPMAAMTVAIFVIAAGAYVALDASTGIFPSSSNAQSPTGAGAGLSGKSSKPSTDGTGSPTSARPYTPAATASGSPSCSPKVTQLSPPPTSSPSATPTPSTTTPAATTSPSPTTTPSSGSTSPAVNPGGSAAPAPSGTAGAKAITTAYEHGASQCGSTAKKHKKRTQTT